MKNKNENALFEKEQVTEEEENIQMRTALTIRLDRDLKSRIKIWCIKNNTTVSEAFVKHFSKVIEG